jgi:hypothetical protein
MEHNDTQFNHQLLPAYFKKFPTHYVQICSNQNLQLGKMNTEWENQRRVDKQAAQFYVNFFS